MMEHTTTLHTSTHCSTKAGQTHAWAFINQIVQQHKSVKNLVAFAVLLLLPKPLNLFDLHVVLG